MCLKSGNRQWRYAKDAAKTNVHTVELKAPKRTEALKSKSAHKFIFNFRNSLQNFRPVDMKNDNDVDVDEVTIPFETVNQFYRYYPLHRMINLMFS